jgi:hypothetical protein
MFIPSSVVGLQQHLADKFVDQSCACQTISYGQVWCATLFRAPSIPGATLFRWPPLVSEGQAIQFGFKIYASNSSSVVGRRPRESHLMDCAFDQPGMRSQQVLEGM